MALAAPAASGGTIKIGLILPMTGQQASTGRQIDAAVKLYLAQHGASVAGRPIEVIVKDDAAVPDDTRRLAQELVVNDKVVVLAGFGITPSALATAPIATQAKTPMVVMAAGASAVTQATPFAVRTSFTVAQSAVGVAEWAAKHKIRKVVTLVSDFAAGVDAEKFFGDRFLLDGGVLVDKLRTPLFAPDFAPVLQKVRDDHPDALFVFLPSGQGAIFMKQFVERGLDKAGVQLIGTGDVTDDDLLNTMGDAALGVVTSHFYSAWHPSALNQQFVAAFKKANGGMRPNFMAVSGYDGMHVIVEALKASRGAGGEALLAAMKGQLFQSPRGTVLIDAQTRDIVQDIYLRKVEKIGGELFNVEFDVQPAVKDPGKAL